VARLRILGIDPGLNRTGFGVIEVDGNRLFYVDAGVIRVPPGTLAARMRAILDGLGVVIATTLPQRAAIEKVFVNVNPQSTLLLGQARGAAICAAVTANLDVNEHTALQVKQAIVGYGRAEKRQVQVMVQRLLGLATAPATDAADALACAICDAHGVRLAGFDPVNRGTSSRGKRSRDAWRALGERLVRDAP
jgi:crossover junction endodeoxyribonuclease RuvC